MKNSSMVVTCQDVQATFILTNLLTNFTLCSFDVKLLLTGSKEMIMITSFGCSYFGHLDLVFKETMVSSLCRTEDIFSVICLEIEQ